MRAVPIFSLPGSWAALCLAALSSLAANEPKLEVWLSGGRHFSGEADSASSQEQLILRTVSGGITIRRPIDWQTIERLTVDGRSQSATAWQQSLSATSTRSTRAIKIELRDNGAGIIQPPITEAPPPPPPPAASLSFYASLANWDADVETDGLIVELAPVDAWGGITPVNGTAEVELWAAQRRPALDLAPQSGGSTIELVERWMRTVTVTDFSPSGAVLKLPFGAVHPEINASWPASTYGLVHVKLTVPGQGVFEASRDGVTIRPFSPIRDRLELKRADRFLPTEGLGRRN